METGALPPWHYLDDQIAEIKKAKE